MQVHGGSPDPQNRHVHAHSGRPHRQGHAADRGQRRRRPVLRLDHQDAVVPPRRAPGRSRSTPRSPARCPERRHRRLPRCLRRPPAGRAPPAATDTSLPLRVAGRVHAGRAGAAAPGAKTVTATNGGGDRHRHDHDQRPTRRAPTGQTVALGRRPLVRDRVRAAHVAAGTDAGSGVDATRAVVERAAATLTNGACGTYGAFAAGDAVGRRRHDRHLRRLLPLPGKATDNVGNVSAASPPTTDAKVDTTPPTTPTLLFTGLSNAAASGTHRLLPAGRRAAASPSPPPPPTPSPASPPTRSRAIAGFTAVGIGREPDVHVLEQHRARPLGAAHDHRDERRRAESRAPASFTLVPDPTAPTRDGPLQRQAAAGDRRTRRRSRSRSRATDGTGSGVDTIRYTIDGTDPTVDDGTEYTKALTVTVADPPEGARVRQGREREHARQR